MLFIQGRNQNLVEYAVLLVDQGMRALADIAQQVDRREPIGATLVLPQFHDFLQSGHANLEELVEVGTGNAQELEPFQQGQPLVLGLLQHALVELQQRQLAIDEQLRVQRLGAVGNGFGLAGGDARGVHVAHAVRVGRDTTGAGSAANPATSLRADPGVTQAARSTNTARSG